ncbi:hypothetical protein NEOC84_000712, partial|nr:hypothetical protein [Neochlamydia sp. AcF84]
MRIANSLFLNSNKEDNLGREKVWKGGNHVCSFLSYNRGIKRHGKKESLWQLL